MPTSILLRADQVIEEACLLQRMSLFLADCCKSLFVSPITNFPGCRRGDRILMWGTTSFCDELTGDFGGAFEATSIDGCRLFCRLAEI
jgi:hypothetical protein